MSFSSYFHIARICVVAVISALFNEYFSEILFDKKNPIGVSLLICGCVHLLVQIFLNCLCWTGRMGILAATFIQKGVIFSLLGFVTTPIVMTVSNHTVTLPANQHKLQKRLPFKSCKLYQHKWVPRIWKTYLIINLNFN